MKSRQRTLIVLCHIQQALCLKDKKRNITQCLFLSEYKERHFLCQEEVKDDYI
jgi:hypothetical protein